MYNLAFYFSKYNLRLMKDLPYNSNFLTFLDLLPRHCIRPLHYSGKNR